MHPRLWPTALTLVAAGLLATPLLAQDASIPAAEPLSETTPLPPCPTPVPGFTPQPVGSQAVHHDTGPPLRSMTPAPPPPGPIQVIEVPLGRLPPPCEASPTR